MKLLIKNTYYFLLFSGTIIFVGAIFLYFSIRNIVYEQIDNTLITEMEIIRDQIEQTKSIPDFEGTFGHLIEVRLLDRPVYSLYRISDTLLTDTISGKESPFRYLYLAGNTSEQKGYIIRIFHTLEEKKELLAVINLYIFYLFLSLLLISILFNYLISWKLWKPFYETVSKAEKFDIRSDGPLDLPETNIKEFRQLNTVVVKMTGKMRNDYLDLKEYNENAAHEIQTPLAIIRSKLEILVQKKELRTDSLNLIKSINEATTKLFKLNQGLLIISKIENLYFQEEKEISLKKLIDNCIINYKEIMQLKKITVAMEANDPAIVRMNEFLAEILISNLISNAVRYNIDGGFIKCHTNNRYLTISNSGSPLNKDPELLFHRFNKTSDNPQSVGLGLSIVKKIADTYKMKITYTCTNCIHELRLEHNTEMAHSFGGENGT